MRERFLRERFEKKTKNLETTTLTNPAANRTPADIMFPMENKDPDNDNVMGRMDARNPIVPIKHNKMILNSVFVTSIALSLRFLKISKN